MKIRASQLGKIMTSPKTKGEVLSKTCKTYLQELAIEHKYGIRKEFWSRYTDKGNECEDVAIELVNDVLDLGFIFKNDENLNNNWITGTPDVNTNEILLDVKQVGMQLLSHFSKMKYQTKTITINYKVICG